jgi:hypothetical protein
MFCLSIGMTAAVFGVALLSDALLSEVVLWPRHRGWVAHGGCGHRDCIHGIFLGLPWRSICRANFLLLAVDAGTLDGSCGLRSAHLTNLRSNLSIERQPLARFARLQLPLIPTSSSGLGRIGALGFHGQGHQTLEMPDFAFRGLALGEACA